tara:strand:+ start:1091 stop:1345 length:255 start_codon:yes stop_codon:yes gene_type:complete
LHHINQENNKMTQYKIVNRTSRKQQILNADELIRFMKFNKIQDYAVSTMLSNDDKLQNTLNQISLGILGFLFVIQATKVIMQWI